MFEKLRKTIEALPIYQILSWDLWVLLATVEAAS
jgi:hypothetical protein